MPLRATPLKLYPGAELVVVMVIAPMLLNALYFWMIDSMIKLSVNDADLKRQLTMH